MNDWGFVVFLSGTAMLAAIPVTDMGLLIGTGICYLFVMGYSL